MMVTFGTYSWVNAILNLSLLVYYIFADVAKWEDEKCNYQVFLWRFLSEKMQESLQNESMDVPWLCITSPRGSIYFSQKSGAFGVENSSVYT